MAIIDTYMTKLRPDLPYMTEAEAKMFKRMSDGGALSIFRQQLCKKCGAFVPKPKEYCSKQCYEDAHGPIDSENDGMVDG